MKRFLFFEKLFEDILRNLPVVKILDVGGTKKYWESTGINKYPNVYILLLNLTKESKDNINIKSIIDDACNMNNFRNNQFDIVFSNSVIEHVGDLKKQLDMANEVQRVAKNYFLQTPNYFFPIEPHFLFIGFHWLPISFRAFLINHFNLGWVRKIPKYINARKFVNDIRLMKYSELKSIFPNATIQREKYFGLTKSFIVYELSNK